MPTGKIISANDIKHNNGTILWANGTTSRFASAPGLNVNKGTSSLTTEPKVQTGVGKTLSAGTFLTDGETIYGHSTDLAGVASNVMRITGADRERKALNRLESIRTRRIVLAGWNYATGAALSAPTVAVDSFGADHAATPSRSVPGEFVYLQTGKTPVQADYPAKTN